MSILQVGLNHKTAPIELRERLALDGCGLRMALEEFITPEQIFRSAAAGTLLKEVVILSTCNRLEIYAVNNGESSDVENELGWQTIIQKLALQQDLPVETLLPHLYYKADREAVRHLMRVASGLDSMILGEPQILGQVHRSYGEAHTVGVTGPMLSKLFAQAVHAGKRARTESEISRQTTSISHAAARLAKAQNPNLQQANVLVVGAGEMAQLAAQAMNQHGTQQITIINRTYTTAQILADQVAGCAIPWRELPQALINADLVLTATGAPHLVISPGDVASILTQRQGRPLTFIDVAVPRDIDEGVDDLQATLDANLAQREAEIPKVEAIIEAEIDDFEQWLRGRQVIPTIVDLRRKAQAIADAEVADAKRRLNSKDAQIVERLAHRLVNKLLHEPIVRLKAGIDPGAHDTVAHVVRDLFGLDEMEEPKQDSGNQKALLMPLPQVGNGSWSIKQ
ncbi:glutamyl-tRNA reductase [Chloroflexi bacterium TSY]|nr:glutamyl-tRNA reductase [Chloroflexi bacterium TSY]